MPSSDKTQHGGSIPIDPHDLKMVTSGSTAQELARDAIFAVDTMMRGNYDKLRLRLIPNLSPVIVVQYDLSGGTYTLVHDGVHETVSPVPVVFQLAKSICHTPLGIYSIIAPYLTSAGAAAGEWQPGLKQFRSVLTTALQHLLAVELPAKATEASHDILSGGIAFIDQSIAEAGFSIESYEKFTGKVQEAIYTNMKFAAEAQISGVEALLKRWRDQLGAAQWKKLYAVVLAIWTTELRNQNWLLLKQMMDPEQVDRHLITISTAASEENTVSCALDNLARIVQDNVAAAMVFPNPTKADRERATALLGPEDLLADTIEKMIRSCPRSARSQPLTFDVQQTTQSK